MTIIENLQKYKPMICFATATVATVGSLNMAFLSGICGIAFGTLATKMIHKNLPLNRPPSYQATPMDAVRHLAPALLAAKSPALKPFLPIAVGACFGNLMVRQLQGVKNFP